MSNGKLLQFPLRDPDLFSGEINRQVLSTGAFGQLLCAAIRAMPRGIETRTLRAAIQGGCSRMKL
jgi:hypothetical protein